MPTTNELLQELILRIDPSADISKSFTIMDTLTKLTETLRGVVNSAYKFQGSVTNAALANLTGMEQGDVYNILDSGEFPAGSNVAWTGTEWDKLSETVDLSGKQDKLTASTGITIDSSSNISISLQAGTGIAVSGNTISATNPVTISTSEPSASEGNDGDLWFVVE